MRTRLDGAFGFVADGYWRYTRNEDFRARERTVRREVAAEFAPRLAAAGNWRARWRLRWERSRALWRAWRALHPSPRSCY